MFSLPAAGTSSSTYIGAGGGAAITYIRKSAAATIQPGALVNVNLTGASALQTVAVGAGSQTVTFSIPINITGGSVTFGVSFDLTRVDNDMLASIGEGAVVKAVLDVEVRAVSRIEGDAFLANLAQGRLPRPQRHVRLLRDPGRLRRSVLRRTSPSS